MLDPWRSARNYVSFWFWVDLVSSVPYSLIELALQSSDSPDLNAVKVTATCCVFSRPRPPLPRSRAHQALKSFRNVKMLKFLRNLKLFKMVSRGGGVSGMAHY